MQTQSISCILNVCNDMRRFFLFGLSLVCSIWFDSIPRRSSLAYPLFHSSHPFEQSTQTPLLLLLRLQRGGAHRPCCRARTRRGCADPASEWRRCSQTRRAGAAHRLRRSQGGPTLQAAWPTALQLAAPCWLTSLLPQPPTAG